MNLSKSFSKNPLAWILGGLLAFSIYSHWQTGDRFTEACRIVSSLNEGYWEPDAGEPVKFGSFDPYNSDSVVDDVMVWAETHERLMQEDSYDGRAYRWFWDNAHALERICTGQLAEPDPRDERY